MSEEIIYCDGKFEVHPATGGGWVVVNSRTGNVWMETSDKAAAVMCAVELNRDEDQS